MIPSHLLIGDNNNNNNNNSKNELAGHVTPMAEWSGGGGGGGNGGDDVTGNGLTKGRSGRRKHWKLPDMIQGVRHRFRDRLSGSTVGGPGSRSKSPDSTLEEGMLRGSQTSVYRLTGRSNSKEMMTTTTYTSFASTTSLPRAASLLSTTDYGFNDWGLEEEEDAVDLSRRRDGRLPLKASALDPNGKAAAMAATTTIAVQRHAAPSGLPNTDFGGGGVLSSFLGDPGPPYHHSGYQNHRPPIAGRRPPAATSSTALPPATGSNLSTGYSARMTRNNSFSSGSCGIVRPQPMSSTMPAAISGHNDHLPMSSIGRTMSVNLVNHIGLADNNNSCDVGGSSVGGERLGGVAMENGLLPPGSGGSIPGRGKSVRFGENRISVFLQDSTQALEECVRLALSYAEESAQAGHGGRGGGSSGSGDYCSDSEAVMLSRQLAAAARHPAATAGGSGDPLHQLSQTYQQQRPSAGSAGRQFWSDSEDRHTTNGNSGLRRPPNVLPPGSDSFSSSAAVGSGSRGYGGDSPLLDYRPTFVLGQAVNSLDRGVDRSLLLSSSSDSRHRRRYQRQRTTTHINEIFSFIDKVLSGCENGCSDEACPMARHRNIKAAPNLNSNNDDSEVRHYEGGGRRAGAFGYLDRPPHPEVSEICRL